VLPPKYLVSDFDTNLSVVVEETTATVCRFMLVLLQFLSG
jgi:hypothetical protein